jgi:hypothetical protein
MMMLLLLMMMMCKWESKTNPSCCLYSSLVMVSTHLFILPILKSEVIADAKCGTHTEQLAGQ